jgi:hypothetical protein
VHLVTARPADNLVCKYDTYQWLAAVGVRYNGIDFTGEKLAFISKSEYCTRGMIACAIDDGPSHVNSYVAHGFRTLMPTKPYNARVEQHANLTRYSTVDELREHINVAVASVHVLSGA